MLCIFDEQLVTYCTYQSKFASNDVLLNFKKDLSFRSLSKILLRQDRAPLSFFSSTPFTCSLTLFIFNFFPRGADVSRGSRQTVSCIIYKVIENVVERTCCRATCDRILKFLSRRPTLLRHHVSHWAIGSGNTFSSCDGSQLHSNIESRFRFYIEITCEFFHNHRLSKK